MCGRWAPLGGELGRGAEEGVKRGRSARRLPGGRREAPESGFTGFMEFEILEKSLNSENLKPPNPGLDGHPNVRLGNIKSSKSDLSWNTIHGEHNPLYHDTHHRLHAENTFW